MERIALILHRSVKKRLRLHLTADIVAPDEAG
jgi:hypothetical protein